MSEGMKEATDRPDGDGCYYATWRADGKRYPLRVYDGNLLGFGPDFLCEQTAEFGLAEFTDYVRAVDPLAKEKP
jgi:hypothetical protein